MKANLCVKSGYSFLSSTLKIDDIISYALENDCDYMGLMDHNVMYGVKEFYDKCVANNIKPIIGLELDVEDFMICLVAKDEQGYKNLVKLSSYVNSDKSVYVTIDDLKKSYQGLIAIVPFFRALKRINKEKIIGLFDTLQSIYQDDFYVGKEIYSNNKECNENNLYLEMLDYKCISFNNIVSKCDSDLEYIEVLKAIEDNTVLGYVRKKEGFEYSSFETVCDFSDSEIELVEEIVNKCNFFFSKPELKLAKYQNDLGLDSKTYLKKLVYEGLEKSKINELEHQSYINRIEYELDVIFQMGFADYFLIVYDYVKYAKEQGILVGPGRGSAAGSLVSYCLGIIDIDPLKFDLLFERFLNKDRVTMPDIDIDFQDNRREEVVNYLKEKYGYNRVSNIVTFSTLSSKQALRDCAKVLGLGKKDLETISKKAHKCPYNATLKEMIEISQEFREFINSDEKFLDVYNMALKIEDLPRQTSLHAAGIVLSDVDLVEIAPTFSSNGKDLVIQYDMNYVESLGLLKMDLLGLRNLTIIDNCLKEIKRLYGININLHDIDLADHKIYKLLSEGKTSGIFQFESEGMRKTLKIVKPNCFIDVCNVLALYRPGPREFIEDFTKRKNGEVKFEYIDESLKDILSSTYGIIVYQEQILQVAQKYAGFSLSKADILRRAMSKKEKEKMVALEEEFINSSVKLGKDKNKSKEVYELILKFASYGFNKAHSVSYTLISVYMAYLKIYYPSVFFAEAMEMFTFSDKFNEYLKESKDIGIKVLLPSVNHSEMCFTSISEKEILYGLAHIKGLTTQTSKEIIDEAKKKQFVDYSDFVFRMTKYKLTVNQYLALIDAGALDEFGLNRATMKHNLDKLLKYAQMFGYVQDGQMTFDFEVMDKPNIEIVEEDINSLELEREVLGYYISEFPLEKVRETLKKKGILTTSDFIKHNNEINYFVGLLKSNKIIKTKKGELMNIATFVDENGQVSAIMFPNIYKDMGKKLFIGRYYLIKGKIENKEMSSIIVDKIQEYGIKE